MLASIIERSPFLIILLWVLLLVISAPAAVMLEDYVKVDAKSFLPSDAESVKAEEELARHGVGGPAAANAIIVVEGVMPSDGVYRAMQEWYPAYRERLGLFSWYDFVELIEREAESSLREQLPRAAEAYRGVDELFSAYQSTVKGLSQAADALPGVAYILAKVDNGYASLLQARGDLQALEEQLRPAGEAVAGAWRMLDSYASLYRDVIRAEALLEGYTNAYKIGLSDRSISIVVGLSDVEGLEPLKPELVVAVYQFTVNIGGPGQWSNQAAADLTRQLIEQRLQGDEAALQLISLIHGVWRQAVSQLGDLRSSILQDAAQGQLQVAEAVAGLESSLWREAIGPSVVNSILAQAPLGPERLVLRAYIDALASQDRLDGEEPFREALKAAVSTALEAKGIPGDYAVRLAEALVNGDEVAYRRAAAEAVAAVTVEASGVPMDPEAIANVVLEYDPEGKGVIASDRQLQLRLAAELIARQAGIPAEYVLAAYKEGAEVAAQKLILEVAAERGKQASQLAEAVFSGTPPNTREEALERAVEVAARLIQEEIGLTEDASLAVARAALDLYLGSATLDDAAAKALDGMIPGIIEELVGELEGILVKRGGDGFLIMVTQDVSYDEVKDFEGVVEEKLGGTVYSTGGVVIDVEVREAALKDIQRSDRVSIVFVLVILAAILGSVLGVMLPFVGIGAGIVLASASAWLLASNGVIDVTSFSRALMFTTGLGLGIDYSAYIVRRYREFARGARTPGEAAAKALKASWRAVVAGALAAAAGFGSLMLATDFPFVASIGQVVPLSIIAVMVASLTLTPALLAYLGNSRLLWWPTCPYKSYELGSGTAVALARISAGLAPILVVLIAGSAILAGIYAVNFEGNYDIRMNLPSDAPALKGLNAIIESYDSGSIFPLYVVASSEDKAVEMADVLSGLDCVSDVRVEGRVVIVSLAVNPLDVEGVKCAEKVRGVAKQVDAQAMVGGNAALNLDLKEYMYRSFYERVLPAAAVLIFIVMLVFYGGILAALSAVATIAIASIWSVAIVAYVAETMGMAAPWYLPVVVLVALLGVGMDYNSFFLNSAREAAERGGRDWVIEAFRRGSALVVGLALIMAGAYAGLMLSTSDAMRSMGAALALGVLLAGVSSALLLTPSIMALLGRRFWWPRKP